MHAIPLALGAALFTATLSAQLTISDGNMNAVLGALSATSHNPPALALRADALATNHGFEHWWYYRLAGDPREFSLRSIGPIGGGVTPTNDHADRDFGNVDNRNLLKTSIDFDVYDAGPASGVVVSRLTVMNSSKAPVTIDLFCYTDLDVAATSGNDNCTGNPGAHFVTDISGVRIEVRALGSDRSAVAAFPLLRNLLTNTVVDNLPLLPPPFTGDYTGAFQWQNRTLQPFQQRTFQVLLAVDTAATVAPIIEHYGAGNGSAFEIHTTTLPLQDNSQPRPLAVMMKNALPNAEYRIGTAMAPWTPLPFIAGIDLWIDPFLLIGIFGGFTNGSGEAQVAFVIPPSPYLAGVSVVHQAFYVNAAAPNGFAYFTPGMSTRVGKL
jgi:hypothetical protein